MTELPQAPFVRLFKKAGAERASKEAINAIREAVEDYAEDLAESSVALAKHARRKTVKAKDVKLAAK